MSPEQADARAQVTWLRHAVGQMAIRYGSSMQKMAYAERRSNWEKARAHERDARRQFAAFQRLANALRDRALRGAR